MGTARAGARTEGVSKVRITYSLLSVSTHTFSRLWKDLTVAITNKDMEAATDAKSAVEDAQREQRRAMEESGQKHVPRFFEHRDGRWEPRFVYVWLDCTSFEIWC